MCGPSNLSEGTEAAPASGAGRCGRVRAAVIAAGGVVFAVLMVLSPRQGFQRDELYFLDLPDNRARPAVIRCLS